MDGYRLFTAHIHSRVSFLAGATSSVSWGIAYKAVNRPVVVRTHIMGITTILSISANSILTQCSLRLADAIILAAVTIGVAAGARIGGGNAALV